MKLTALGVWGGYPTRDAGTTSYLLQSEEGFNLLLDAGSRAVTELEHELSPNDLDAIILSHYHEDHIADLGALRQYRQLQTVKPEILPIYGHQENEYEFSKLSLENVSEGIAYDVENGTSVGPFDIQFLKQVLIYTGDTGYFAELVDFSKDADILLADVYFFKDKVKMPNHLSSVEAGEIAAQANVKKLVLTHLPQVGDLQVLREEAQEAAGNIPVDLAQPHMKWTV